ncbi:hypothetical protein BLNAU_6071 [Blattamonas nauphoetae]|uniref:Secreted protein n=1 Tax=Blattamonas nauphoetae TaxID=2049346 RepID=A0ABQ9Y5N6_9EUKA|nr:hypothetical protein BLNAU_6071 [Blattamonas nauphoetae]
MCPTFWPFPSRPYVCSSWLRLFPILRLRVLCVDEFAQPTLPCLRSCSLAISTTHSDVVFCCDGNGLQRQYPHNSTFARISTSQSRRADQTTRCGVWIRTSVHGAENV